MVAITQFHLHVNIWELNLKNGGANLIQNLKFLIS